MKLEPPSPERLERLIHSVIRTCESSFCERILEQLSVESQQKLDALLKTEGALDEDEHSGFKQSDFNLLKTDPGRTSLESILQEVQKLGRDK